MRKPPILNFACSMNTSDQEKPFFYDNDLNLNLIEINGSQIPFVEVPTNSTQELFTKTARRRETDDEAPQLLEFATKTKKKRETDEESLRMLELETKTLKQREDDDHDYKHHLELLTKTKKSRESDDY